MKKLFLLGILFLMPFILLAQDLQLQNLPPEKLEVLEKLKAAVEAGLGDLSVPDNRGFDLRPDVNDKGEVVVLGMWVLPDSNGFTKTLIAIPPENINEKNYKMFAVKIIEVIKVFVTEMSELQKNGKLATQDNFISPTPEEKNIENKFASQLKNRFSSIDAYLALNEKFVNFHASHFLLDNKRQLLFQVLVDNKGVLETHLVVSFPFDELLKMSDEDLSKRVSEALEKGVKFLKEYKPSQNRP